MYRLFCSSVDLGVFVEHDQPSSGGPVPNQNGHRHSIADRGLLQSAREGYGPYPIRTGLGNPGGWS